MATADEFVSRVEQLAEGSPYVVTRTAEGCDVGVDLADARWYTLMAHEGLSVAYTHHVALDPQNQAFVVTDESREVTWRAGADGQRRPVLQGQSQVSKGRVYELSGRKVYAWGEDGQYGEQVNYALNSEEGRALLKRAGQDLGWSERMSGTQRIGIYVAIGAVALVAVIGVIALVIALV